MRGGGRKEMGKERGREERKERDSRPIGRIFRRGVTWMPDLHKHARLEGLGACSPRRFFKNRCSEIASEVILGQKQSRSSYTCHSRSIASNFWPSMYIFAKLISNFQERRY